MSTVRRNGPGDWENVHATARGRVRDVIDLINPPAGAGLRGAAILKEIGASVEGLVQEARAGGHGVRAIGSSWALTDIAVTDGFLLNTQPLNGRFNVPARYASDAVPADRIPFLLIAQCGATVSELNRYLELEAHEGHRRVLRTAGIGAGQTIVGAVSGNTHGSAIRVGAMPDFVVGIQLVNGTGTPIWLERASQPIMNDAFVADIGATLIRDDELFGAALVSFGSFGVITAVAIETDPIYQLRFPPQEMLTTDDIKRRLGAFDVNDPPDLHHYEFVFDPYSGKAMEAEGVRVPFEREFPTPTPRWLVRGKNGFAPGNHLLRLAWHLPLPAKLKASIQLDQYREKCILGDVQGTPGQLFTATITYSEGMTETAFAVSITDAPRVIDVASQVVKRMSLPVISQVRVVHPTRATLGFTHHGPKSVVFEFGLALGDRYRAFESALVDTFRREGIRLTFHWSKNSGLSGALIREGYGDRVDRWLAARRRLFGDDPARMAVFANDHLRRGGLAG